VQQTRLFVIWLIVFLLVACGHRNVPKSPKCFDDIRDLVRGKNAAQIDSLLGHPDLREKMVFSGERWVWWDYTYLDGNKYPPDLRGRLVHLEIIFEPTVKSAARTEAVPSELWPTDPLAITYTFSKTVK
jgi:hypothetical protein